MTAPYIPATDSGFLAWSINFESIIDGDFAALGLTGGQAAAYTVLDTAYQAAYAAAVNPATRTPVTVQAKDNAKTDAIANARVLAQIIKSNPAVSDATLISLGITVDIFPPTPVPTPTTFPLLDLLNATPGVHKLQYRDSDTPLSKAKPPGAKLMELYQAVGVAVAPDPSTAVFLATYTKSPLLVAQDPANVGKVATYFARWLTQTGLVGPWSSGVSLTIAF